MYTLIQRVEQGLTTVEDARAILELMLMIERLVDVMERSDLAEFEGAEPVSSEEWFGAIHAAKELIHVAR